MLKQGEVDIDVVRMPFSEDGLDGCYAPADPMAALIPAVIHCDREKTTLTLSELSRQPLV